MRSASVTFLGTGGAWGLPELHCQCLVCTRMRQRKERRQRTAFLLNGPVCLLIDCGPDIASQLARHPMQRPEAVLLTHEHGDHYLGLDELFSYKRTSPKGTFKPIPIYVTRQTWEVVRARFGYLEEMEVIEVHEVEPGKRYGLSGIEVIPFKTFHGAFASGSVGYIFYIEDRKGKEIKLVYTSDFLSIPNQPQELFHPDYLIIQSFWFNEPVKNTPNHMSFQRSLEFIQLWEPKHRTFLVHIGDCDPIPGDPSNQMLKKREAADPLRPPSGGKPYPIPIGHEEWERIAAQVTADYQLPCPCTVAYDDMKIDLSLPISRSAST